MAPTEGLKMRPTILVLLMVISISSVQAGGVAFGIDKGLVETVQPGKQAGQQFAPFLGWHTEYNLFAISFEFYSVVADIAGRGDFEQNVLLVRFLYRRYIELDAESVKPYFSAGIGLVDGEDEITSTVNSDVDGFVVHLGFGAEYSFSKHFAIGAEGRWERSDLEFTEQGTGFKFETDTENSISGHVSLTFRFGK